MQLRLILLGLVLAQLADAATFTVGVARMGIGYESNGIATALFSLRGVEGVLVAKAIAILVTLAVLVLAGTRYPRLFIWGGATATSFGVLGAATNVWSMSIVLG